MKNNLTIKKISELAGVSKTTVSFVLNNRKGVSDKTRKKVMNIIEQEDYTPNINSRRLILKRSFNIAFMANLKFSIFSDFFVISILKALMKSSHALGYNIVVLPHMTDIDESNLTTSIKQGNVDGVIIYQDISSKLYNDICDAKLPLVIIDSQIPNPPYPCVRVDYEQSAYTAVKYLIECGHKDIAYIGIEKLPNHYIMCLTGYLRAMSEASLPTQPHWLDGKAYNEVDAYVAMEKMLQYEMKPTAVFCGNDMLAIGAIRYTYHIGYRVPDNMSYVSIDDIELSKCYNPALTTIHINADTMGRVSIEMLQKQIEGKHESTIHLIPSDQLIIRDTVKSC